MAKGKVSSKFVCQSCGHESVQWYGRCPQCEAFNTMVEEVVEQEAPAKLRLRVRPPTAMPITKVQRAKWNRISTGITEFDRVLGGGMVPGSTILLGGEPGIGKSTLLLQALSAVAQSSAPKAHGGRETRTEGTGGSEGTGGTGGTWETGGSKATKGIKGTKGIEGTKGAKGVKVLYVTGEESLEQIGMRAERTGVDRDSVWVMAETDVLSICEGIENLKPLCVAIDSIQTMSHAGLTSSVGSVSQIRESAAAFIRLAKERGVPIFFVGHVTKEGVIAGPRVLEHMVDTVLYMEGEAHYALRVLRASKNRFGPAGEVGVFRITEAGLEPVDNPSEFLLSQSGKGIAGSATAVVAEGKRPLLVEVQALVVPTYFGTPRRLVTGADFNRVLMLIAVLSRRGNCRLGDKDIYVNVAGGIRVVEPAADLPIALAIASAYFDRPLPPKVTAFGEIGLGGEVRAVSLADRRLTEAGRLGFNRCIGPLYRHQPMPRKGSTQLIGVGHLREAMAAIWGKEPNQLEYERRQQELGETPSPANASTIQRLPSEAEAESDWEEDEMVV